MLRTDLQHDGHVRSRPADGNRGNTRRQVARFLVVGTLSVIVDFGVYTLLTSFAPLPWGLAKGISYASGVVVGFFGNKFWTFQSPRRRASEPALYLLLYSGTLLLNIGCNQAALWLLGAPLKLVAFLFATGVTTLTNFLGMKYVAFRRGIEEQKRVTKPETRMAKEVQRTMIQR